MSAVLGKPLVHEVFSYVRIESKVQIATSLLSFVHVVKNRLYFFLRPQQKRPPQGMALRADASQDQFFVS